MFKKDETIHIFRTMLKFSRARQEQKLLLTPAAQMFVLTDAKITNSLHQQKN